mmetsp:Transcript_7843/g.11726  ORF Transcript_7843/g.11726 Transcript_7843/m.11726 type:complete len:92 (+) Transcript_7843:54-329(+)
MKRVISTWISEDPTGFCALMGEEFGEFLLMNCLKGYAKFIQPSSAILILFVVHLQVVFFLYCWQLDTPQTNAVTFTHMQHLIYSVTILGDP